MYVKKETNLIDIESNYKIYASLLNLFHIFASEHKDLYLVGGCVRDLLLGKTPKDYDLCTNATPEELKEILVSKHKYHTIDTGIKHGTITIYDEDADEFYEITTYRIDGKYLDYRHPVEVTFTPSLEEDLKRRDFTINSFAYDLLSETLVMLDETYLNDLRLGIIRTVGNPNDRFSEDALRMLRAIRFAAQLNFSIDKDTYKAIQENSNLIKNISKERIRDELTKVLLSDNPQYLEFLSTTGLEEHIFPQKYISNMLNCDHQNPYHYTDVFHHTMDVIKHLPKSFILRYAALFHDIGKPNVKKLKQGTTDHYQYIGHPEVSTEIADEIMDILKFSNTQKEIIHNYVLYHDYHLSKCSIVKFKKFLRKIGSENFLDFMNLREADALAHKLSMSTDFAIDSISIIKERFLKVENEPLYIKDLKINGDDLLKLGYEGKQIGNILNYLLDDVLMYPKHNTKDILLNLAKNYDKKEIAIHGTEIIVLSGIAGIGKSTWAANHKNEKTLIVSSDETRFKLTGTYDPDFNDKQKEKSIWDNVLKQIEDNIKNYNTIIVDACALTNKKRMWYWHNLHKYTTNFTLVMFPNNPEIALEQNNNRERHVPENVIRNMGNSFEEPNAEVEKCFKIIYVEGETK